MSFYAANFIYDSIISSEYGLRISSDNSNESSSGANVELYTQQIYRRPKVYLLGVQQAPVLTIPIYITVPDQLSSTESSVISKWLFGRMNYKKLQIIQSDMQYVYYNCIFTDPTVERVGNVIRGYHSNIVCDSPFAWEYPKTLTYNYQSLKPQYAIGGSLVINNTSDNADYTYPSVEFTMNNSGGLLSITNATDGSRVFSFTGLSAGETIAVDNDIQTITSSISGANRLSNFVDYKWLRYVPGINTLWILGDITTISFTHQFAKKIS